LCISLTAFGAVSEQFPEDARYAVEVSDKYSAIDVRGGRALVLKGKKLGRLGVTVEVVHRAHAGRREILVVTPRTASDTGNPRLR
jgi:hypothetical protein